MPPLRQAALHVARTLRDAGHTAYFAGGCVRDELLGAEPQDYDVATDATPDRVAELFPSTAYVGAHFGVMIVRHRGVSVEVATFRREGPYSDRRRPDSVVFADPSADAARRDFTINALFLDPFAPSNVPGARGRVIDFVGGLDDLHARVIRAVGDPDSRLNEDHLRALRAVRLSARLGFEIDPATARAITRHATALEGVSRERIGDEIRRMLTHPARARAADLLADLGLEQAVLHPPASAEHRTLAAIPAGAPYPLALAAWAIDRHEADQPEDTARTYRARLMLSNAEHASLRDDLAVLKAIRAGWHTLTVAGKKRLAANRAFPDALALCRTVDPALCDAVDREVRNLSRLHGGLSPPPLITGDDLVAEGWKPGPEIGRVLEGVYDAQIEGRVATRQEALELARKLRV